MSHDDEFSSGNWTEVLGEQLRGGQSEMVLGDPAVAEVLGDIVRNNPAFRSAVAKRIAGSRPVVKNVAPVKARDFTVPFTAYGTVGQSVTVTATPQCLFRPEKLIVNEIGSSTNGYGSTITGASVGQKNQMATNSGGLLSAGFLPTALGNGIRWDTCQPALTISITVSFLQTCTWYGALSGKAVL